MSLKAKIEAVIYAAEEPVTLSQLVAIFAGEIPVAEAPENLQASLDLAPAHEAEPVAEISSAEITTIDASGFMHDAPTEPEDGGPRLVAELQDATPATSPAVVPETSPEPSPEALQDDLREAAKRADRLREREVRDRIREVVDELISDYATEDRGIEIREIAGGFRMATKPEFHDAVRAFVKSLKPPMKLSLQALETLAVIAYKQPVTAPEVGEIRGVDSGGVLAGLISRKLVTTAGRKQVIGRPILYKTTKEFLMRFGLKDIAELPSMEEFEKMAGELAESDALEASAIEDRAGVPPEAEEAETEGQAIEDTASATQSDAGSNDESSSRPERGEAEGPAVSSDEEFQTVPETVSETRES